MSTHTPIPYWLSMPWAEARAWFHTVVQIENEDAPRGDGV